MFKLDWAYLQGDNNLVCNSDPGTPHIGGNGGTSCFKGWFIRYIMQGRVGGWDDCEEATIAECLEPTLGCSSSADAVRPSGGGGEQIPSADGRRGS